MDTQELLEKKALRNVRALVDLLEDGERRGKRTGGHIALAIGLPVAVLLAVTEAKAKQACAAQ
jgi:hypothetical protein